MSFDFITVAIYAVATLLIMAQVAETYKKNPKAFAGFILFGKLIIKLIRKHRAPKFTVSEDWHT